MASTGSKGRVDWPWWTPCCPPNLARLVGSLSGYLFSQRADALAVHHYVTSEALADDFTLRVQSEFPFGGASSLEVTVDAPTERTFYFRIPAWSEQFSISINGETVTPELKNGYAEVGRVWNSGDSVKLEFAVEANKKFSRYEVDVNRGRLALTRGPLVYCLEQVDNGPDLDAVTIASDASFSAEERSDLLGGITALTGPAVRERTDSGELYSDHPPATEDFNVTAVPYYAWNNRGPGEMLVWVRRAGD
jgi:DUF1680 family protein